MSLEEFLSARGRESAWERSPSAEAALLPAQGTLLEKRSCFFPRASLNVSAATKPTDGLPVRVMSLPDIGTFNIKCVDTA